MLRFAPSPTKDMDISDLRIAIFNHLLSKQKEEALLIRIEDIDTEKNIEGKDKEILELLSLFSIDYSHVVYQSENLKYHQKLVMQLMNQKKAFACFCGDEKLEELKQEAKKEGKPFEYDGFCETLSDETVMTCNAPFTVRIQKSEEKAVDSFIILNHDKAPMYDYACAVDDMLYDVSTVIRSKDYISSAPKQTHVRSLLNYDKEVNYMHLSNISSTKNETVLVKELIDEGFLPSAIANYLVALGNETSSEIFTLEEAIAWFDINKISNDAIFDINKLKEINKKHLETMDDLRLSKILGFADADIGKLAKLYLNNANTIKELKAKIELVFSVKSTCQGYENQFVELKLAMNGAPFFNTLDELKIYISSKTNLKDENLDIPLEYILTGTTNGPDISKIYPLIKNYLGEIAK